MREYDTINGAIGCDRNVINDAVNRVAEKLEAGNKRYVKVTVGEPLTQCRWMIEINRARPSADEWKSVEILYAADAQHFFLGAPRGCALPLTRRQARRPPAPRVSQFSGRV